MEVKYNKSKIYRLECNDGYYYYGSTYEPYLSRRLANHRCNSKKDKYKDSKVYTHINSIGWDNVKIVLVEAYSCNSVDELKMKENEYITIARNDPMCLNNNRAYRTDADKQQQLKDYKERLKEERNKLIKCECGIEHTAGRTQQHLNSKRHKMNYQV